MKERKMSDKEIKRAQVIDRILEGTLTQKAAAARLSISDRHVRRLKQSYAADGVDGLVSKRRGLPSNRRLDAAMVSSAQRIIGSCYADFGPTLATEKLHEQHGIKLSVETVRKLMMRDGHWKPRRGAKPCAHPMRTRRARRGEMIQIDGSPHDWFEGRSPSCCLLVFIDDATSQIMSMRFVAHETTLDYMAVLEAYIHQHGIPLALYSDRHSIFRVNAKEAHSDAQTQFSRSLAELGIESIHAHSPQAKGRVERANQTLQDRLVKEMRLQAINTPEAANAWLPTYIADHNQRFAVPPAQPEDAHVSYTGQASELRRILSVQTQRTLSKNLSCQYNNQRFQVQTTGAGLGMRGAHVMVHQHHDGTTELTYKGRLLACEVLTNPAKQQAPVSGKEVNARVDNAIKKRSQWVPSATHPWKKSAPQHPKTESTTNIVRPPTTSNTLSAALAT